MLWFMFFLLAAAGLRTVCALVLDIDNTDSIREVAATIAQGLMGYYQNAYSDTSWEVGLFPFPPYYWWESGAAWGSMVDYWAYTGDKQYLDLTIQGIGAQVGPNFDFVVPQQVLDEANDDQEFWVFTALAALEQGVAPLACPDGSGAPGCETDYEVLANNAFEDFVSRWDYDSQYCGGGLRWQYTPSQKGYNYKNTISNAGFFQIAARLARYSGNSTYADWAAKVWTWCEEIGFIGQGSVAYDGAPIAGNCTDINKTQWSYNIGVFMYGAAMMYDYTRGAEVWKRRLLLLLNVAVYNFFGPYPNSTNIMFEPSCEPYDTCSTDQLSYKAYLSRYMAKSALLAPFIQKIVTELLENTAIAAAQACNYGSSGSTCGTKWYVGGYDGQYGLGQQMTALETVQALLARDAPPRTKNGIQPPVSVSPPVSKPAPKPAPIKPSTTKNNKKPKKPKSKASEIENGGG